jgi:hypothetical protein
MQNPSSQSAAAVLGEHPSERVVVRIGEILGAALRDLLALWREREERRRDRVPAAFAHMDARMLRDVGAPEWLVDCAAAERQQWQTLARYLGGPPSV